MRRLRIAAITVFATCLIGGSGVSALAVPTAPALERPVVDQTGTLSEAQIKQLSGAITEGRSEKSYQLGVLIIPTLGDAVLEDYSLNVARTWRVGEKDKNNGVLLLVVKNDRKLRIEVGSGLEGDLTDAESGRIIRNTITPQFKEEKYFEGILAGVTSIRAQVEGRAATAADAEPVDVGSIVQGALFVGFFGISWLSAILARSKNWWAGGLVGGGAGTVAGLLSSWSVWSLILLPALIGGGLLLDWLVSRNFRAHKKGGSDPSWWAGGGWLGGSGGSSGGSFGGGGFSGGGSSGSW